MKKKIHAYKPRYVSEYAAAVETVVCIGVASGGRITLEQQAWNLGELLRANRSAKDAQNPNDPDSRNGPTA